MSFLIANKWLGMGGGKSKKIQIECQKVHGEVLP